MAGTEDERERVSKWQQFMQVSAQVEGIEADRGSAGCRQPYLMSLHKGCDWML
jgi:hypothetical protein